MHLYQLSRAIRQYESRRHRLPWFGFSSSESESASESDDDDSFLIDNKSQILTDECVICLCTFLVKDRVVKGKCNHVFHQTCIQKWLKKEPKCPLCRQCFSKKKRRFSNR